MKGIVDREYGQDGFKALVDLNHRYDQCTSASLLGSFLEVVSPPPVRGLGDVIPSIHRWEAKVAALKSRYGEEVAGNLKHAIFIGMMPKELQDVLWQNASMVREAKSTYESSRDYILNLVNQKLQMMKPVPMDVGGVEGKFGGDRVWWYEGTGDVTGGDCWVLRRWTR